MRILFSVRILASLVLRFVVLAWLPLPLAWWLCAIIGAEVREVGDGGGEGDELGDWEARATQRIAAMVR
jgi:hypothetical protein